MRDNSAPLKRAVVDWWQRQPRRQQRVAVGGMALGMAMLIVIAGIMPAYQYYTAGKAQFAQMQSLAAWVDAVMPQIKGLNRGINGNTATRETSLLSLITQVAAQHQVPIERAEPREGGVSVWIGDVEFDRLIDMLFYLNRTQAVDAVEVQLATASRPSYVTGRVVLR